jgi:nicotinamidase/pyrazinamidase
MKTSKEAVIVVDYQNDFANPGNTQKWIERGSLYVNGGEKIVRYINTLMTKIKSESGVIISTQDWHPTNHTSFAINNNVEPFTMVWDEMKWPNHCVQNTFGANFLPWFDINSVDERIYKGFDKEKECYSWFWGNKLKFDKNKAIQSIWKSLTEVLREYNIQLIHIVWLATDYCVKATALDGIENGFQVKLHKKWIAAVNAVEWDEKRAIEEMQDNKVELVLE